MTPTRYVILAAAVVAIYWLWSNWKTINTVAAVVTGAQEAGAIAGVPI